MNMFIIINFLYIRKHGRKSIKIAGGANIIKINVSGGGGFDPTQLKKRVPHGLLWG